jgi:hypothetical protein
VDSIFDWQDSENEGRENHQRTEKTVSGMKAKKNCSD